MDVLQCKVGAVTVRATPTCRDGTPGPPLHNALSRDATIEAKTLLATLIL